jgi:glycerol-3-phosphate dehydrogenase
MAQTLEDVLARRTRALLLDAKASLEIAPAVLKILAKELKQGRSWQQKELAAYARLVKQYLPK